MLIAFICTGNICRSPMAEHLFRQAVPGRKRWEAISAGVAASYGAPASRAAVTALAEKGVNMSSHASRPLTPDLARTADLIVAMTAAQRDIVSALYPAEADKVFLLRAFDPSADCLDVEDPIGMTLDTYREIRDQIAEALPGLVEFLRGYSK